MNRLPVLLVAAALWGVAYAQTYRLTTEAKTDYASIRDLFLRAAEKMPGASYGFKPTPEVRTFAQQVAHVADDQYNLCAPVKGETRNGAYQELEMALSSKGELVPALKKAFAYCDSAYDSLTDATATDVVQFFKSTKTKLSMLNWNVWHTWEHYGNVVVYLRLQNLVPPSSEKKP